MIKQKNIEFTNLKDFLDNLEQNSDKYRSSIIDNNTVFIGNACIRRYIGIDPENTIEQYCIFINNKEFLILPNNKIWCKDTNDFNYTQMKFSENDAESMYYTISTIFLHTLVKNYKRFSNRQTIRDFLLIFTTSVIAILVNDCSNQISKKIYDKKQENKEIKVSQDSTQMNQKDTIIYDAVLQKVRQ
ncbi:MAG: hypothetical protein IKZ49_04740 [Alphaproteobacteria bacterium]|nr:hypothetical protein [Alphaproteobacteria bacterium]